MFLMGYSPWGMEEFNSSICIDNIYRIECCHCKIDELKIDEDLNVLYNSNKQEWDYNTVLQAKFQDNLEAGNISNKGIPIEFIQFRKREIGTLEWRDIATFKYDTVTKLYQYMDRYVQSTEEYEYAVVPITANVIGKATTARIICDFDDLWLVGKDKQIKLRYDNKQGDYENITQETLIEPIGSQYPIMCIGSTNYAKTSLEATIISDEQVSSYSGSIQDKRHERIVRDNVLKFLRDNKPKIYKTGSGKFMLVKLSSVREKPINEVGGVIASISAEMTEIGNPTVQDDLRKSGLIEVSRNV